MLQDLDPEIFEDRYAIKVKDLTKQNQTVELVKAVEGIAKVNAYEEIAGGFITYCIVKTCKKQAKDVHPVIWVVAVLFILDFIITAVL